MKYVPDCRVAVDGQPLDTATAARLTRAVVDLDAQLFGRAVLEFHDPDLAITNGKLFSPGVSVRIKLGFGSQLAEIFAGEVVALEPQFRRDVPPALNVVCLDSLHRLALSQQTRALNDVDDAQVVQRIAQEHGLTAEAPSGTSTHLLQGNVTDAALLRRIAQKHGGGLRIEGKKVVIGPPAAKTPLTLAPGDGVRKVTMRVKTLSQVSSVSVHGWDPAQKREIVSTVQPSGERQEGAKKHGQGTLSLSSHAPVDTATAETLAKNRLAKLSDGFVTAEVETRGDARLVPGFTIELKDFDPATDGQYRIDRVRHTFSRHGYWVKAQTTRTGKPTPPPAQPAEQPQKEQPPQEAQDETTPRISFWRPMENSDTAQPVQTPVALTVDAAVVGRLHKYGQRPLAPELVTVRAPAGVASVTLQTGSGTATVAMRAAGDGAESEKKLLFHYGDKGQLQGAQWDDVQLVDVSASGSAPFATVVSASGGSASGQVGLIDVLAEDPDSPGTFRTLSHGVFRTRTPKLRFVLPNLDLANLRVFLDDGDDATDDELDITALVHLDGPVTTVEMPRYVRLGQGVTGLTNRTRGRDRVFQPCVETPPEEGDVGLFVFGENRIRVEQGRGSGALKLFTAWSFHHLDAAQTVGAANGELEPGGLLLKNSLTVDFADSASEADVSRVLRALRLKPVSYCGQYRLVEARTLTSQSSREVDDLKSQIDGFHDQLITEVARTPVLTTGRGETGFQERLPSPIAADYNAANHTFNTAHELHWHHFVLHTFAAHRLIESRILAQNRPDTVSVAGAHFATNSAFLRPSVEPDMQRIVALNGSSAGKKIAIFGHTDSVGTDAHNNALSQSRARSMNALLRHQIGFWYDRFDSTGRPLGPGIADRQWALHELGHYNGPIDGTRAPALDTAEAAFRTAHPAVGAGDLALRRGIADALRAQIGAVHEPIDHESRWGTDEMREMLRRLGFYNGPAGGSITAALRAFQHSRSLTEDGSAGVATWIELIRQYQNALVPAAIADGRFHANAVFGCGEAFPVMPLGNDRESQQNRRVEVIFRTNPVNPVNNALVGSAVPYPDWLAPEIDVDPGAAPTSVVVALTDSGLGRGAPDNWSGDLAHQTNHLQIRGERMVRPTRTTGAAGAGGGVVAVSNATPAIVNPDGDLRNVNDGPAPGSGIGHGTAVMTCLAAEGPVEIAGTALAPNTSVLGVAPHVKIRPIAAMGNIFAMLQALEVIAADPEVKVYSTSLLFQSVTGMTANSRRALQERTQELLMGGRIAFAAAANYNGNPPPNGFPGIYHTVATQFGSIAGNLHNSRSTFTGANVYQQRLAVVGASKRMGLTTHPEMGPPVMTVNDGPQLNPGQFETGTMFTYIGEQVAIYTPGEQIRAIAPTGTQESTPPFFGHQNPAAVGAGLTIGGTDGTSFATPMTAGIAAELMLVDPTLQQPANLVRVLEYLEATADPLPRLNPNAGRNWPNAAGLSVTAQRVNDPVIAGNAAHAAFSNIRRTNFWKAVLAAVNGGLSSEGRTAAGGNDNFFTGCPLKDHNATSWYGFELRTLFPDAVVWFRKASGELVEASDAGALFPNSRILGSAWITTDAYDAPQGAQRFVLPAFPWLPATLRAAGRVPYFMAQLSIEKAQLANYQSILLHLSSTDPRVSDDPPAVEVRVDNMAELRNKSTIPAGAPEPHRQAIRLHLDAFDDFVFHVTQKQQPLAGFRIVPPQRRNSFDVGEEFEVRIYAVDAQGYLTDQGPAQVTVTHNGTNGTAAHGVSFNGNPVAQAGAAVNFGAGADPRCLARLRVLDRDAEALTLTINDGTHPAVNLALTIQQATASDGLALVIRRRGGAALDDQHPPRAGDELEVEVRAVDAQGRTFTGFTGDVHLGVAQGLSGRAGPPQTGLHVKQHAAQPFDPGAFTHHFTAAEQGVHVFSVIDFSAGALQLRADAGARTGVSQVVQVQSAAAAASFRVQVSTPQVQGNAFDVVVAAIDATGNIVEDFTGAVTLSRLAGTVPALGPPRAGVFISDSASGVDDMYDFVSSDRGIHRFRVTAYTVENIRVRAAAGAVHGDSAPVAIQAGVAVPARFQLDVEGALRAGHPFNVRVTAVDGAGRRLTSYAGNVALAIVNVGPPLAPAPVVNPANHAFAAADQGQFVFSVTSQATGRFQVSASAPGVPASNSANIDIVSDAFDHFRVIAPASVHQNTNFNVQVTAQDQFNNTVTNFLGQVQVVRAAGVVAGAHSFVLADNGTFAVQIQLPTLGVQQVSATDQNVQNVSNNITVVP